jgi:hypothetical protein
LGGSGVRARFVKVNILVIVIDAITTDYDYE